VSPGQTNEGPLDGAAYAAQLEAVEIPGVLSVASGAESAVNADLLDASVVDDAVMTNKGQSVLIVVLANDVLEGVEIDPTTVEIATPPPHGLVAADPVTGEITFTPNAGFLGITTFTYTVEDVFGSTSLPATVTVTVKSPWQNPLQVLDVNDDTFIVADDVLAIVNRLNSGIDTELPDLPNGQIPDLFFDVDGDGHASATDAIKVINWVNLVALNTPPTLAAISDVTLVAGAPLNIALDGFDLNGDSLSFAATSSNGAVTTYIPLGNESLRLQVVHKNSLGDIIQDFGTMEFQLFDDLSPLTTAQIKQYVEEGKYDNLTFHRVIEDFMVQGGDPSGTGGGGFGQTVNDEYDLSLRFTSSGVLAMAKSNDDTGDSQFFITARPTRWLDFNHAIFGYLTKGDDVRQAIASVPVDQFNDKPDDPVVITSATIFQDVDNGVLRLSAPAGFTGTSLITVTASDGKGGLAARTFNVTVIPDTENGNPFLAPISEINMSVGETLEQVIQAYDAERDAIEFLAEVDIGSGITFDWSATTVIPIGQLAWSTLSLTATQAGDYDFYVAVRPIGHPGFDHSTLDVQRIRIHVTG
jgi:cyclophilin family peptidyl-prolyl cis-trans isomerase